LGSRGDADKINFDCEGCQPPFGKRGWPGERGGGRGRVGFEIGKSIFSAEKKARRGGGKNPLVQGRFGTSKSNKGMPPTPAGKEKGDFGGKRGGFLSRGVPPFLGKMIVPGLKKKVKA